MALPPKFKGHRLLFTDDASGTAPGASKEPIHTLELYLDYVCPFSAKIYKTFTESVAPLIRSDPHLAPRIQLLFRQQLQPWHPSSTLVHEAALAVLRLSPAHFYAFSTALFEQQKSYFDIPLAKEPRNETYQRLAVLAEESTRGAVRKDEVYRLLEIPGKAGEDGSLNAGNGVTADVKTVVKMGRLVGIHVSPTAVFDGVVAGDISSGWTGEQWIEWLKKNVV